ncbi:cutinase-domain-containing protein [Mycena capillaripes]|nr:cutinase-domain-containing protein [Mycena capillaripes]
MLLSTSSVGVSKPLLGSSNCLRGLPLPIAMILRIVLFSLLANAVAYPRKESRLASKLQIRGVERAIPVQPDGLSKGKMSATPALEHHVEQVRKRGLLGLGLDFASAPVEDGDPLSGSSAEDSGGPCTDVIIIFARGTNEVPSIGSRVGPQLNAALKLLLGSANKTLTFSGVDYPADLGGFFEGGSPEGSFAMARQITNAANLCPDAALGSVGYSQGAQLVHNSARLLTPDITAHIKVAVTFGDPDRGQTVHGVPEANTFIICHPTDVVCDGVPLLAILLILNSSEHLEESDRNKAGINHDKDAAAAKLWAVYVSEAEKYDKSLVETWKSDMEGLLIFAALFSAILTAFLIESYKSLTPDAGDLTVHILGQISQQLAASANGSTIDLVPIPHFTPTPTSIVCNVLWFISLGFSLACALIATLVQQWSRNFLHKADMRSAPIIRARIFSYLYYGLKRFQMHAVVEVIPLLLHASLILFFCGLVAFLIPVNITMTVIAATVLGIVVAAYSTLTLLPLRYLDCPYRTPLSGTFWGLFQLFKRIWHRHRSLATQTALHSRSNADFFDPPSLDAGVLVSPVPGVETMVEAMSRVAMDSSDERSHRDYKALAWTMKSLTDDTELEPFVEAIPDLLWGPSCKRTTYEDHIKGLLRDPEVQLLGRIHALLDSCHAGILSSDASQRRKITCCKTLWAIASLSVYEPTLALDFTLIRNSFLQRPEIPGIAPYITSATAMMGLSTFLSFKTQLVKIRDYLIDLKNEDNSPELNQVYASWDRMR